MDNSIIQRLKEVLLQNDKISIVVGKNPNLDEMGAALGLYLALKNQGKTVSIACPTEPIVELSSLVGINKVGKEIGTAGGGLVVSFPYQEGEIEKVSYTLENGFLNIVVKAGTRGLSFSQKDVVYKKTGEFPTLLFVVGTPRLSDLGNLFDPEGLKETTVVNIDNKSENQGFGEIVLVSPKFSSISEAIANLIKTLGFDLDIDISQNLMSGISFATNNFQDQKTSSLAFEMAAFLMKQGAKRQAAKPISSKAMEEDYSFPSSFEPATTNQPSSAVQPQPIEDYWDFPEMKEGRSQPQPMRRPLPQFPRKPQPQSFRPQFQTNQRQQVSQAQPVQNQRPQPPKRDQSQETPSDWLSPKIYKGSTNI